MRGTFLTADAFAATAVKLPQVAAVCENGDVTCHSSSAKEA
jgi:hypothetical protein